MSALSTLQIGLIASATQTSGSDRYYFSLLHALRPLGVGVRGVVLGDPTAVEQPFSGVTSFAPEGSRALRRWMGLRRTVTPLVPPSDVVVTHFAAHAFPVLDRIRKRPIVVHFHNPWLLEGRAAGLPARTLGLRWLQERAVYAAASRFIVLSRANGRVLEETYGVQPGKIRVVPGAADLRHFGTAQSRADARQALGWPANRPIVTVVARLVAVKGVANVIRAIQLVRRQIPDVFLAIVGDGPLADDLRRMVHDMELTDTVHFAGYMRETLPQAYRAADIAVVPSIAFESFGLVAAEALACGTPVLVTPVLGLPEVVSDLDPALVLDGTTADDIARGLGDALTGRLALPDESACVTYAQRFDWPTIAARIRDVYAEVA